MLRIEFYNVLKTILYGCSDNICDDKCKKMTDFSFHLNYSYTVELNKENKAVLCGLGVPGVRESFVTGGTQTFLILWRKGDGENKLQTTNKRVLYSSTGVL